MDKLNKLLDKCREMRSIPSDAALARELHVTRGSVSNWRTGVSLPDEVACARISDLTGEPLGRVLGLVGEARAVSKDAKAVWRRLANAAALVLLVGAAYMPSPAAAKHLVFKAESAGLYIMSSLRRAFRGLSLRGNALALFPA